MAAFGAFGVASLTGDGGASLAWHRTARCVMLCCMSHRPRQLRRHETCAALVGMDISGGIVRDNSDAMLQRGSVVVILQKIKTVSHIQNSQ